MHPLPPSLPSTLSTMGMTSRSSFLRKAKKKKITSVLSNTTVWGDLQGKHHQNTHALLFGAGFSLPGGKDTTSSHQVISGPQWMSTFSVSMTLGDDGQTGGVNPHKSHPTSDRGLSSSAMTVDCIVPARHICRQHDRDSVVKGHALFRSRRPIRITVYCWPCTEGPSVAFLSAVTMTLATATAAVIADWV